MTAMTSDRKIERLRAHLEKRRDHAHVFVSVNDLTTLLKEFDKQRDTIDRGEKAMDIIERAAPRIKALADEQEAVVKQRNELLAVLDNIAQFNSGDLGKIRKMARNAIASETDEEEAR